jgi:phospholipase/carboxylesterase
MSDDLVYAERLATGDAAGLLVLHHGRGADEFALLPLADMLDPQLRLHVVTPRAPLALADESGFHWYVSRRVGYPDADTFHDAYRALARLHDRVWERFGVAPDQTVLGGFSLGSGMSYSLGLGADRPPPAGILAFSGAIPAVDGWKPDVPRSTGARTIRPDRGRRVGTRRESASGRRRHARRVPRIGSGPRRRPCTHPGRRRVARARDPVNEVAEQ